MSEGFLRYPYELNGRGGATSSFRLINHTVMTRAEAPTVDSWVHLAQTRRPPLWATAFFTLATVGAAYASVHAGLQLFGVIEPLNETTGDAGRILGMIVMAAIAVACGWVTWLMLGRWHRSGSVGARPSGVALGASGVVVRVPGRDVEIPWGDIRAVKAKQSEIGDAEHGIGRTRTQRLTLIELTRDPHAELADRVQLLAAEGYKVPTDALYTALRWYHEHPESQWELGRIEGERRLEGWRLDALRP